MGCGTMQRMSREARIRKAQEANPVCGARHPSRRNVRCDRPREHERWAHQQTTMTIDLDGFTQESVAWVDWSEVDANVNELSLREAERARRVRVATGGVL